MTLELRRTERLLKTISLIFVYSAFLTPWLTQTFTPYVHDIRFRFVWGDLVVLLAELPADVSRIRLESDPNNAIIIALLVFEMLFTWLTMSKFKHPSGTLEVAGAILGLITVALATLNFLKVGFSSPQDFQMTLMPGFFFGLAAALLLLLSYAIKLKVKRAIQTSGSFRTS